MKTLKIAIISAVAVSFAILSVYAYRTNNMLKDSENTVNELIKQVKKAEETYNILSEIHDRQDRVICDYQEELRRLRDEQFKKISIIETKEDARDWLDSPVPDSIRMLFREKSDPGCGANTSPFGIDDAL